MSIQMNTSKPDVYVKLSVLDHEEELISTVGKGHVVIPSYIFLKDILTDEESGSIKRSASRSCEPVGRVIVLLFAFQDLWKERG